MGVDGDLDNASRTSTGVAGRARMVKMLVLDETGQLDAIV